MAIRVALACSGLGRINRGHEIFARDLFELLKDDLDISLFKGGGAALEREVVVPCVPRNSPSLNRVHLAVSPKWMVAAQEVERMRVEGESFAWGLLGFLLEGGFDIVHCLEREVCDVIYGLRHLFEKTPRILWSNGGAIKAAYQPRCDFVQEHTEYNARQSRRRGAFVIPHGVDVARLHPGVRSDFRARHGIPERAFVVISVGTICYWHKRTDYVIREVATIPGAWLIVVGQESIDTPDIKALGHSLMPGRIVFASLPHGELPSAYAAANVFALGSTFETFGIVYIEAMAMGLPVFCTDHPNQRSIVKEGVFVDVQRPGRLAKALRESGPERLSELARRGPKIVAQCYDMRILRQRYLEQYALIASAPISLPGYTLTRRVVDGMKGTVRRAAGLIRGLQ